MKNASTENFSANEEIIKSVKTDQWVHKHLSLRGN